MLKQEIDAREQYRRDKALLFAWRARLSGEKEAQDVRLRLEEEFQDYLNKTG